MNKNDVINLAYSEEEYTEKAKKYVDKYGISVLYDTVNFSGSDNLTKYAYELNNAGLGHPNGFAWCQTFIAFLYWKCYKSELANKLLCGKLKSASTMEVKNAMVSAGRLVSLVKAEPGDIVFRSRSGGGHVGLVVGRSSSGQIITVEGNTSPTDKDSWNGGCVARHVGASWEWCCRPDYSILPPEPKTWRWIHVGNNWYYQNQNGVNKHGWALIKETKGNYSHWYWFDNTGKMATGWLWIDNKLCLFMPSGDLEGALCRSNSSGYQDPWNIIEDN